MLKFARWLAVAFALFLAVAEVARNKDGWQWWPFWTVDYLAVALLLLGAFGWRRAGTNPFLTAGWGFTCAMFWMSFFSHLDKVRRGAEDEPDEARLTAIIGALFVVTVVGFVLSLIGSAKAAKADERGSS